MKSESFRAPNPPDATTTQITSASLEGKDGPTSIPQRVRPGNDLSIEVVEACINRIPDLRTRVVVDMLANVGLSVKQVIRLRWEDLGPIGTSLDEFDLAAWVANRHDQMTKLQLPVGVITRLRELWGHKEVPNTDPILASRDRKFQNHAPTALTEKSVYQLVKTAFERHVGIPSITPRTLRAYFVRTYAKERQSPPTLPTPYSTESFSEPSDPHLRCNLTDLWFPDEGY